MRLPISMKSVRGEENQHSHGEGDLVIDESGGSGETPSYPTTTTPIHSPYNDSSSLRPTPTPTPSSTTSYEQIGHNFTKPSSSTLSLLASAASKNIKTPAHRFLPYLRHKDESEFVQSYYPTSSIVHSNGIWTPSTVTMAANSNASPPAYEVQSSAYEEYHSQQSQQGSQHDQIASTVTSTSAGVEGESSSATSFLYEMNANLSNSNNNNNNNGYNHSLHGGHHQYKIEASPPPPLVRQYHSHSNQSESPIPVDITIKNAFFTQDKVDTLCDVMLRDKNYTMLIHILHGLPKDIDKNSENVLRARAALANHNKNYKELYNILENNYFSVEHHKELQELYQSARYSEAEIVRDRPLGAVDKYRIRKKYILPKTIWDGEPTSYTFKDRHRKILMKAFDEHKYPTGDLKTELQRETNLTKKQIDNWFKNRRQRELRPEEREGSGKMRKTKSNQQDRYVLTPASSAGSGSTLIYSNMPYHSPPMGEDSMDIKYSPYLQGTAAQMKSYNSMSDLNSPPSQPPKKGRKKANNATTKNAANAVAWAKEAAALVGEKLGKRSTIKSKAKNNFSGVMHTAQEHDLYMYPDLYNLSGGGGNNRSISPASSMIVNVGGTKRGGVLGDSTDQNLQTFHHNHQQYSGSCGTVLINHHQGGLGVSVGGWGTSGWHSGGGGSTESPYSSILPSLAASFNHHSHSHHHHSINPEARIQVQ